MSAIVLLTQLGTTQVSIADDTNPGDTSVNAIENAFAAAIANRPAMTSEIIDRLRDEADAKGLNGWESELTAALNSASDEAFLAAYNNGNDYKAVAAATAGISFDKAALVNNASAIGSGGTPAALLGDADKDFVYTPITPCRIVDTRNAGGKITGGNSRGFSAHGSNMSGQGGNAAGCTQNGNGDVFAGYVFNITVTQPNNGGFLTVYAQGDPRPNASILNYTGNATVANSTIVKTGYLVGSDFRIYTSTTAHVIVDVMGYFDKPERTSPDVFVVQTADTAIGANGTQTLDTPSCPAGYRMVSGGLHTNSFNVHMVQSKPVPDGAGLNIPLKWRCSAQNTSATASSIRCIATCLSIPGK